MHGDARRMIVCTRTKTVCTHTTPEGGVSTDGDVVRTHSIYMVRSAYKTFYAFTRYVRVQQEA